MVRQINTTIQKVALCDEWKNLFLKKWGKDNKKFSTTSHASAQNLETKLHSLKEKQARLVDAYLDQTITKEEFTSAQQKIVNQHVEISEKLNNFGRKGNNWLELFRNWILEAHQANRYAISENLEEKRKFLQKIGSDFHVIGQKMVFSWENPWGFSGGSLKFSEWSG